MKLWLDDIRNPSDHGYIGWVWVKTADECIAALLRGDVEMASLDHDLSVEATLGHPAEGEKTGYHVCCFLEENPHLIPPWGVTVHSMNPAGRKRMTLVLEKIGALRC